MSNQIPFSGATNVAGGYLLPPEQGEILVQGILVETGAIQLAGDARSTKARKTNFPIWLGRPTAGPVAEGAPKGVTGASFGQATLNIQKFASIVLFTDEQIEDLQNGDLNVLADAGVRQALSVSTDSHAVGLTAGQPISGGSVFDSTFAGSTPVVDSNGAPIVLGTSADALQKAVSAAMGVLEANGYGDPADMGALLGFGFQRQLRDARDAYGRPLYDGGSFAGQSIDPLYGIDRAHSTNLAALSQDNTTTVDTTNGSAAVTIHPSTNKTLAVINGAPITGANIPANSFLSNVVVTTDANGVMTSATANLVKADGVTAANATSTAAGESCWVGQLVASIVHRPNLHVRVREDVRVKASNEASIVSGATTFNLFQENLTALLYELRLGHLIHDAARSVVPVWR